MCYLCHIKRRSGLKPSSPPRQQRSTTVDCHKLLPELFKEGTKAPAVHKQGEVQYTQIRCAFLVASEPQPPQSTLAQ